MKITNLKLTNFRNYEKFNLHFSNYKNIIINKNEKDIELKATIQNTTSKEFKAKKVTIVFLNDEKQVVTKYRYYLNNIKVGESTEIELIGENIGYASDFEIKD